MALNMKQEKKLLASALFKSCDAKRYHGLAQSLTAINVSKGQRLSFAQEQSAITLILDGSIDICTCNGVLVATLSAGDFLEIESLDSDTCSQLPLFIRARTAAIVTYLERQELKRIMQSDFTVAMNYIRSLTDKLQKLASRFVQITAPTPSTALGLYMLGSHDKQQIRLQNGLAGLARRLNISRATLYRALADLEGCGLVSHHEKTLCIEDLEGLNKYCLTQSEMSAMPVGIEKS